MFTRKLPALALAVSLVLLASCGYPPSSQPAAVGPSALTPTAAPALARALDHLPLYFVENQGQTDPRVAFYLPGRDQTIYFTPDGLTFAFTTALTPTASAPLPTASARALALSGQPTEAPAPPAAQRWSLKLGFVGANPNARPIGQSQTQALFSYFKGQPSQWQAGVPSYSQIRYPDLWPGIDLVYSGQANQLKYEFELQPGADPAQIQLAYRGASSVRLTADGQLEVTTPLGGFRDAAPLAYQVQDGQRVPVQMSYALNPSTGAGDAGYSLHLGAYNASLPLVLDPVILVYAGYIGGASEDYGEGIAVDSAGNAYITSYTYSDQTTFPVTIGPDLTFNGSVDGFVVKVSIAYAIYGRVMDRNHAPLAGVVVSAGAGGSAATDASGAYTMTITIGAYVLTPTLSGYTFSPPTRAVSVPPGATGQNFVGTLIPTPTLSPPASPTATLTGTAMPTMTPTATHPPKRTPTSTSTPTRTATVTPSPTNTPRPTPTQCVGC